MSNQALFLASEINELEKILADIPEENIIEHMSFKARLASAKQTLANLPEQLRTKAKLTFRGKPVTGSYGINADFGSKAAGAFSEAFTAISVALTDGLRDMEPIPKRDKNQLLITGTAIGSFGFEFELPEVEPNLFADNPGYIALEKIEALFRLAASGSDDDVAEVIEEVHPRAVRKVYEFLDLLVQQQAWCGLEFSGKVFRYSNYEQLKAASERLKEDNIHEKTETFQGEFQGVLPSGRTFEFCLNGYQDSRIIKGRIDSTFAQPELLNRDWLLKPIELTLNVIQVGQGRPRYTLVSQESIQHLVR